MSDEMKTDFEPKCAACKAACRIEGWSKCWDLCTCECHLAAEKSTKSGGLNAEFIRMKDYKKPSGGNRPTTRIITTDDRTTNNLEPHNIHNNSN